MGGEAVTDSSGQFAFPKASNGTYMVQVSLRGFAERRLVIEVPKGTGRELGFPLTPASDQNELPGGAVALWELSAALSDGLSQHSNGAQRDPTIWLRALCDVPKIRSLAGDPTTVILNGVTVLREVSLCSWRMDEIALIEFCSLGGCYNPDAPRPLRYPDPSGRRRPGVAITVWEKR
jgi:hypothetical protein